MHKLFKVKKEFANEAESIDQPQNETVSADQD